MKKRLPFRVKVDMSNSSRTTNRDFPPSEVREVATRKSTNTAATQHAGLDVHTTVVADHSGRLAGTPRNRTLPDHVDDLIQELESSLNPTSGDAGSLAATHLALHHESVQLLGSMGARRFGDPQASSLPAAAECAPVSHGSLPMVERLPEISSQLIVVEHLFQAAREKGSGAIPMPGDEEWDSFWLGLERIVRQVRRLAENMYEEGRVESY